MGAGTTTKTARYFDLRHPTMAELGLKNCYICGGSESSAHNKDHIIPKALFQKGDWLPPYLPVHQACNNQKSADDRWFSKQLLAMSSLNPLAAAELTRFLDRADQERLRAGLVGEHTPNYILAKGLFEGVIPSLEVRFGGETLVKLKVPPASQDRMSSYAKRLCRGLFWRNVIATEAELPRIRWFNYGLADLHGKLENIHESLAGLIKNAGPGLFCQQWGGRILYYGSRTRESPSEGFLFIEFYRQVGILALFGEETAKAVQAAGVQ